MPFVGLAHLSQSFTVLLATQATDATSTRMYRPQRVDVQLASTLTPRPSHNTRPPPVLAADLAVRALACVAARCFRPVP